MKSSRHLTLFLLSLFLLPFFTGCQVGFEPPQGLHVGFRRSALNYLDSGFNGRGVRYTTARSDFDRDGSPELVYLRTKGGRRDSDSTTKLEVFSHNGRFQLLASKEIQADTLSGRPATNSDGARYVGSRNFDRLPSMALGALDNTRDKQDEIVLAYDNNGRVLVEVYRLDLQAGQLVRWAFKELEQPGDCGRWGCRPSVTVGDFDRDGKIDVAVAFENVRRRPMIVMYGFVVRADGSAVLQEKVRRELGLEKICAKWGKSSAWRYAYGCKVKVAAMKDYENNKRMHRLVMTHESGEGQVVVQVFDLQKKATGNTLEILAERRFGEIGKRRRGRHFFAHVVVGNYYGSVREEIAVLFVDDIKRLRLFLFSFEGGRLKDFPCKPERCHRKWDVKYPDRGHYRLMNIPQKQFDHIAVQYHSIKKSEKLAYLERFSITGGSPETRQLELVKRQSFLVSIPARSADDPKWGLQQTTLASPLASDDGVDTFRYCELPSSGISCDSKLPEPPRDPEPTPPSDSSSSSSGSSSQAATGMTIITLRTRDSQHPCEFVATANAAFYPGTIRKIVVKGSSLRYLNALRKDGLAAVNLGTVHSQDVTVNDYNGQRAAGDWKLIAFGRLVRNGRPDEVDYTCRNVGHLTAEIHWRR